MSESKDKDSIFTFRLNKVADKDIIDYIHSSRKNNSAVIRDLLRNAFDRSMDFQMYQRLLEKIEALEKKIEGNLIDVSQDGQQQTKSDTDDQAAPASDQTSEDDDAEDSVDFSDIYSQFGFED